MSSREMGTNETPELLALARERLTYDPASGQFAWKTPRGRAVGKPRAGNINAKGYVVIRFGRISIYGHRLAWAFEHGVWPETYVDHENRQPASNTGSNLRTATHSENLVNSKLRSDNT